MIQKKICMLGAFAVGKTSLVSRFVRSVFSEKYLTTLGVKIDKKMVRVDDKEVMLMLWDLAGEDEFNHVRTSYLKGASGYLLVVDGTRPDTLKTALDLNEMIEATIGQTPFVTLCNKVDLVDKWRISEERLAELKSRGWLCLETSAKTGQGVENAFHLLAEIILNG